MAGELNEVGYDKLPRANISALWSRQTSAIKVVVMFGYGWRLGKARPWRIPKFEMARDNIGSPELVIRVLAKCFS